MSCSVRRGSLSSLAAVLMDYRWSTRLACHSSTPVHFPPSDFSSKAGEGNRTLVFSLEGYCSTIELHPQAVTQNAECKMQSDKRILHFALCISMNLVAVT